MSAPTTEMKQETNPAIRRITVTLPAEDWGRLLTVYRGAVLRKCYPATWRPSEAVMTKAAARSALAALELQINNAAGTGQDAAVAATLTYSQWDSLQGEVAHWHQSKYACANDRIVLLETYRVISERLGDDPADRNFIAEIEAEAAEVAEEARLERELAGVRKSLEERRRRRVAARLTQYDRVMAGSAD